MTTQERKLGALKSLIVAAVIALGASVFAGCEQKEKVLDIETPTGEVEIERSKDNGNVDVKIKENRSDR